MQKLLEVSRKLIISVLNKAKHLTAKEEAESLEPKDLENQRDRIAKLIQLQNILERDKFEGLTRKV